MFGAATRRSLWSWSLSTNRRIKLVVAYDGSDFSGWAKQKGRRTVHGILTTAVRQVSGEENEITGASRTDSGAHALGQVCHFDTESTMPPERWARVLNRYLPADISVVRSGAVSAEFHSRFWAVSRWYRYRFLIGARDVRRSRYGFGYLRSLDASLMHATGQVLVGQHDFRAFSEELTLEDNAERNLEFLRVRQVEDEVHLDVVGSAFARGMMRRMAGGLWEVGRGYRAPDSIARLLDLRTRDQEQWPVVLPAHGLTLMKVFYGRTPGDQRGRWGTVEDQ